MGVNNRQRRKAKQKARQARQRDRALLDDAIIDLGETIEGSIHATLHAKHVGDNDTLARGIAFMADPLGSSLIDVVFAGVFRSEITACWETGWQPADLARAARRQCDNRAERMMIDLIAAELRQYAAVTIDERWEQQLKVLDAKVWWERDDHYFKAWAQRHGTDRTATIGTAVDVLYLLGTLPELPRLGAIPGEGRRGSLGGQARREVDTRMLERVRALLAKAESTTFPEEAEACTAKAQELMARHSIDYALLAARQGTTETPGGRRIAVDNPYEEPKALLLDITAEANRCRAIWSRELGFSTILGYPSDVDTTELLFTSLLVQATAAMRLAGSPADGRTTSFRRSFLTRLRDPDSGPSHQSDQIRRCGCRTRSRQRSAARARQPHRRGR